MGRVAELAPILVTLLRRLVDHGATLDEFLCKPALPRSLARMPDAGAQVRRRDTGDRSHAHERAEVSVSRGFDRRAAKHEQVHRVASDTRPEPGRGILR